MTRGLVAVAANTNWVLRPASIVGVAYGVLLVLLLATHAWDPLFFATLGPQWGRHDPTGQKGFDGQFFYAIAVDPTGAIGFLDPPAYRMARILYPLVARGLAFGQLPLVPWTLMLVNWAAIVLGTEIMHRLLASLGASPWMALAYGAWGGLGLALLRDTAEPLTYLCALLGIWWLERGRTSLACGAFFGAILGGETALLLVGPYLAVVGRGRTGFPRWLPSLGVLGLWVGWLVGVRLWVGAPLRLWIPSLLPLAGFSATRLLDLPFSLIYLVIPALVVVVYGVWGLVRARGDPRLWAAVLNGLLVLSLPPETAALLWHSSRVSSGLIVSTLLSMPFWSSPPWLWRGLATLYMSSACWTAAVGVRYLLWDVVRLPGG